MKKKISWLLCLCMLMCAGCADQNIFVTSFDKRYLFTLGERRVTVGAYETVFLDVQRQYEAYYGDLLGSAIWSRETGAGESFADYVKQDVVLDELVTLELLQVAAEQLHLGLSEEEQEDVESAAHAYLSKAKDTLSYTRLDQEQIQELMEKYCLAEKVIQHYAEEADLEVSENEARAIRIQVLQVPDQKTAKKILDQVQAGASFLAVAESFESLELEEYNVVRGELLPKLEEAAFALESGECSEPIETDDGYDLIYCVNSYLEDMTQTNQESIVEDRIYAAWHAKVEELREELPLYVDEYAWKKIKIVQNDSLPGCFFETYQEWFPLTLHAGEVK